MTDREVDFLQGKVAVDQAFDRMEVSFRQVFESPLAVGDGRLRTFEPLDR